MGIYIPKYKKAWYCSIIGEIRARAYCEDDLNFKSVASTDLSSKGTTLAKTIESPLITTKRGKQGWCKHWCKQQKDY